MTKCLPTIGKFSARFHYQSIRFDSRRGQGWKDIALAESGTPSPRIRFATAELESDGSFSDEVT